jgi:hypothetical protein
MSNACITRSGDLLGSFMHAAGLFDKISRDDQTWHFIVALSCIKKDKSTHFEFGEIIYIWTFFFLSEFSSKK